MGVTDRHSQYQSAWTYYIIQSLARDIDVLNYDIYTTSLKRSTTASHNIQKKIYWNDKQYAHKNIDVIESSTALEYNNINSEYIQECLMSRTKLGSKIHMHK